MLPSLPIPLPHGLGAASSAAARPKPGAISAVETQELSRLALVIAAVVFLFALVGVAIVAQTGDVPSAVATAIQISVVGALLVARRRLQAGEIQRGVAILIGSTLVGCLVMAAVPPPVPALAAGPIMAVAFALSFLHGRGLKAALVSAWICSIVTAAVVELTPASPDMPAELAAVLRVVSFGALVGLVGLVLYRHRLRLEQAMSEAGVAANALRESEVRYRTVVEGVREVIYRVDGAGRWVFLNRAWEELTGYRVEDALGRPVTEFIHPEDRAYHAEVAQAVARGEVGSVRAEYRLVARDGHSVWVEAHGRPVADDAGRYIGGSGTLTDVTLRRELAERLVTQAFHDELTGLANRALFKDRVEHALTGRPKDRSLVGLLFLDLDRFKTVNDSLGHTVGDELLVAIAARLHAVLRNEDTIARLGGDEFGILVDDVAAAEDVLDLAERVTAAFGSPFQLHDREIAMRCSVGVVVTARGQRTADDLLRDADVAMYRAKASGHGSYALFEPSMQAEVAARMNLESDLRSAIENEQFTLVYQPIVTLPGERVVGVEALARWCHPVRGNVPPSVFIPAAEESGLILQLGRWVLRQACLDLAALRRDTQGAERIRLAVNLSPRQVRDTRIVEDILEALGSAGLPADALDLEITESLVLDCGAEGIGYLQRLRAAGCGVAFDDFGTGFSSLGSLRSLPVDVLKIDRSFVASMLDGGVDGAVVDAVIRLGAALDVAVVAEGVEDSATAARLAALGCPLAQGYHFGFPGPMTAIADLLRADGGRISIGGSPQVADRVSDTRLLARR